MKQVLILFGDATQALPIAKSLCKKGFYVDAICSSKWSYGYGSRYIRKKYIYKETEDVDKYFNFLINILKNEEYDTIIPMRDSAAEVMSRYKDELLKYTHYEMPDYESFECGYDKHKLMEICEKKGYPHPETYLLENGNLGYLDLDNLPYPMLIKPNHTFGARGMTLCLNRQELEKVFPVIYMQYGDCHLQEYIPEGGNQVEVQLYVNAEGELLQSSVIKKFRWYPVKGGSSCCNISYENSAIVAICHNILKEIGWVGFADFDTIEDPRTGELLIMELNPRVPACVKSAFASGIDWSDIIVGEYLHKEHKTYKMEKEVYLRHLGFELLWFIASKSKWHTKPNWFKFIGKNIYYQDMSDWTDWGPFVLGTLGNIIKLLDPSFRKSKSGNAIKA